MERRIPTLTVVTATVTAVATGLAIAHPAVVLALQRTPTMIQDGQWWRLVSPILVNPESRHQIAFNGASLLLVGSAVERLSDAKTWLTSYIAGAVAGEVAGLAWQPVGAGSSVAICGLLGALAVIFWHRVGTTAARAGTALILTAGAALTYTHDLHGPPMLAGAVSTMLQSEFRPVT